MLRVLRVVRRWTFESLHRRQTVRLRVRRGSGCAMACQAWAIRLRVRLCADGRAGATAAVVFVGSLHVGGGRHGAGGGGGWSGRRRRGCFLALLLTRLCRLVMKLRARRGVPVIHVASYCTKYCTRERHGRCWSLARARARRRSRAGRSNARRIQSDGSLSYIHIKRPVRIKRNARRAEASLSFTRGPGTLKRVYLFGPSVSQDRA